MANRRKKFSLYDDPLPDNLLPVQEWVDDDGVYCEDWYIHEDGLQGELLTVMDGPRKILSGSSDELCDAFNALHDYAEGEPYRWIAEHDIGYPLESAYRSLRKFSSRWTWEKWCINTPPFHHKQYPGTTRRPFAVWLLTHLLTILDYKAEANAEQGVEFPITDELVRLDVMAMIAQNQAGTYGYTQAEIQAFWLARADYRKAYDQVWNNARGIAYPPPRF